MCELLQDYKDVASMKIVTFFIGGTVSLKFERVYYILSHVYLL
jgi:hypothetical protein